MKERPVDTRRQQRDDNEDWQVQQTFTAVIEAIRDLRELPVVSAFTLDDDGDMRRQRTRNATASEYLCDVEAATRHALTKRGILQADLWNAFVAIVEDESVTRYLKSKVIRLCGKAYGQRGLQPGAYMRRTRHRSTEARGAA